MNHAPKWLLFAPKRSAWLLLSLGIAACSPDDGSDASQGGSGGQPSSMSGAGGAASAAAGAGGTASIPPRQCKPGAATPSLTITGTSCGNAVQYVAPEGTRVLVSHVPLAPGGSVNAFTFADTQDFMRSLSRDFLRTNDISFHVNMRETTDFAVGSTSLTLRSGSVDACGLGTIFFKPETPVTVAFESITPGPDDDFGRLRLRLSGVAVDAATSEFGATQVAVCASGGELALIFDGEYERVY